MFKYLIETHGVDETVKAFALDSFALSTIRISIACETLFERATC